MRHKKIKKVYLNWKGIIISDNIKSIAYIISFILSIVFVFISAKSPPSFFVFGITLILVFSLFLKEKREYRKKYEDIFEQIKTGKDTKNIREWIDFLERNSSLPNWFLWTVGKLGQNKKFERIMENG